MKKVLLISREYTPCVSGASIAIYNYIKYMKSLKFFIISYFKPEKSEKNIVVKKVKKVFSSHRYLSAVMFIISSFFNSFTDFDCILGNALIGSMCGAVIKFIAQKPLVSIIYDVDAIENKKDHNRINKFFRKIIFRCVFIISDVIIIDSQKVTNDIVRIFGEGTKQKIVIIHCGARMLPFKKIEKPKGKQIVLFVGAMLRKKGIEYLIEAFKTVSDEVKNAELWIVGSWTEKDYYNMLKELTKKLGIDKHVTFTGRVDNVFPYYDVCDVLVAPSYCSEGCPLPPLEASAMGKPIVATDLIEECGVVTKQTGLVVPRQDPKSMAEAIIKLLKDKKLREKLGHAGKEYAKQFDWAVLGKKMEELILDSIKSK